MNYTPELVPKLRGRAVYLPMKLLWYYLMSVGMVYFGIPQAAIYSGFLGLCQHEAYKEKETEYGERLIDFHSTTFAAWKIFEQFGEAIPQVSK